MKEYVLKYINDRGETRVLDKYSSLKMAKSSARCLVESAVWIDVYEVKKAATLKLRFNFKTNRSYWTK